MSVYLYRLGDGNEGSYPRELIEFDSSDDLFAAIQALILNRYIVGSRTRQHIRRELQTEGETEFGVSAYVLEGPAGETAFGAAWITAELEPLSISDLMHYENQGMTVTRFADYPMDRGARAIYRKLAKGE